MQRAYQSGFSIIFGYAAAAVGALALQLVPYLGWIVLAAWGPLWVGYLTHLMLLHLAGSAVLRKISRAWLVLPIAYYGGGFALHLVSVNRAHAEASYCEGRTESDYQGRSAVFLS